MDMGGALGGGATIFLYCIRERELVLDLFESLVGARLLYGFHQVGGVRYDMPDGWAAQCRKTIDLIDQRIDEYEGMLEDNAVLPPAHAGRRRHLARAGRGCRHRAARCCAAPASNFDLRRAQPYSSYEDFEFTVPVETAGDCFARYRVRMVEFRESIADRAPDHSTACPKARFRRGPA